MKGKVINRKPIALLLSLALIASSILLLPTTALALSWSSIGNPTGQHLPAYGLALDNANNLFAGCGNGNVYYNTKPTGGGAWIDDGSHDGTVGDMYWYNRRAHPPGRFHQAAIKAHPEEEPLA